MFAFNYSCIAKLMVLLVFSGLIAGCAFNGVFFPTDNRPDEEISRSYQTIPLTAADGNVIQHFMFKPEQPPKATIFVFQGSGSKVVNWYKVIKPIVDDGFQVFMMEYRGFGKSQGNAEHLLVAQDAINALGYLANREDVSGKPILLLGQSYGGQLAIYAARQKPQLADAIITEGTFSSFSEEAAYSVPNVFSPLVKAIFRDPYVAHELIAEISAPALIIHSEEDKVVPFHMAETLYAQLKGRKTLWRIQGKHVAALVEQPQAFVDKLNELFLLVSI